MPLPPFAAFPPAEIRGSLPPQEWEACLDAWISLSELYLQLKDQEFASLVDEDSSLSRFLVTLFRELAGSPTIDTKLIPLRKKSFLLVHRIYTGSSIPQALLGWTFLADLASVFPRSDKLRVLLSTLWKTRTTEVEKGLQVLKTSLIKILDSKSPQDARDDLSKLCHLLHVSPEAGVFMLTGSDFLDSLFAAYPKVQAKTKSKLVMAAYLGLSSLLMGEKPNYSLLSDHLYSLKSNAEQAQNSGNKDNLLAELVTKTPLSIKIRDSITTADGARVKNIASSLAAFKRADGARPKKLVRRKIDKGKARAKDDEYGHGAFGDIHVHRMSLVSQVQDLFPDLGSGFVVKLLDEYNDNVELVTQHLLEDSLPTHLNSLNRTEQL